jgi:hypothetical protein
MSLCQIPTTAAPYADSDNEVPDHDLARTLAIAAAQAHAIELRHGRAEPVISRRLEARDNRRQWGLLLREERVCRRIRHRASGGHDRPMEMLDHGRRQLARTIMQEGDSVRVRERDLPNPLLNRPPIARIARARPGTRTPNLLITSCPFAGLLQCLRGYSVS